MAWYDITGTIADWVMASAAVYAAYKAKNFFDDKVHSDAYELIKKIVVFQFYDLTKSMNEQYSDAFRTTMKFNINTVDEEKLTTTHIENSLNYYVNTTNLINSIESNIKILNKLKFKLTDDANILFDDFIKSIREFQEMHSEFINHTFSLLKNNSEERMTELKELIKELELSNLHAIKMYLKLYHHKDGFLEYFTKV